MVRRINLVPATQRARTKTDVGLLGVVVGGIVVVAIIGLSYSSFSGKLSSKQDELSQLQAQNQQLAAQLASLADYEVLATQREATQKLVQEVYAGRTLVSDILGDLSLVMPENAWLSDISIQTPDPPVVTGGGAATSKKVKAASLQGSMALNGSTYKFQDVATFLVRLEQMPSVSEVVLGSAGLVGEDADSSKSVRSFSVASVVMNTQDPSTALPLSEVEVSEQ